MRTFNRPARRPWRVRLLVYGSLVAMMASSALVASARIERAQLAARALGCAQQAIDDGRLSRAATELQRLTEEQPDSAGAHAALGDVWASRGREAQALDQYRAAADLDPDDAQAYYEIAASSAHLGRYDVAQRYLARRVRQAPHDAYARRLLGFVSRQQAELPNGLHRVEPMSQLRRPNALAAPGSLAPLRDDLPRDIEESE